MQTEVMVAPPPPLSTAFAGTSYFRFGTWHCFRIHRLRSNFACAGARLAGGTPLWSSCKLIHRTPAHVAVASSEFTVHRARRQRTPRSRWQTSLFKVMTSSNVFERVTISTWCKVPSKLAKRSKRNTMEGEVRAHERACVCVRACECACMRESVARVLLWMVTQRRQNKRGRASETC